MTYMDDKLFYDPEEAGATLTKVASNLGKDTQLWSQQIKAQFEKENSPLVRAGGNPFLDFTYKDLPQGTAVGGITITVGGRILLFPVVIKDNELSPFDTFYDQMDKSWHFMTDRAMNELSNNSNHYKGLTSNVPSDAVNMDLESEGIQVGWRNPGIAHTKTAGRIPGVPDATGPRGRGAGPGGGRADGSGFIGNLKRSFSPTDENKEELGRFLRGRSTPDGSGPHGRGEGPGGGTQSGIGLIRAKKARGEKLTKEEKKILSDADGVKTSSIDMSRMKDIAVFLDKNPSVRFSMEPKVAHLIKVYFHAALHSDDMIKEASANDNEPTSFLQGDVAYISKVDIDHYSVKVASFGGSPSPEFKTNSDGVRALAGAMEKNADKILDDLDISGSSAISRGISVPPRVVSSATDIDPRQKRGHIGSAGTYSVLLDSGQKDTGLVLPILDWQGEDTSNYLFCSTDNYLISDDITGVRSSSNMVLPRAPFSEGARGVFVKENEGLYFSTWPIKIESIWSSPGASNQIKAVDTRNMTKLNIIITDAVKVPTRIDPNIAPDLIEHGRQNVYIPNNMKFAPLPESDPVKLASSLHGAVDREEAVFEMNNPEMGVYEITKNAKLAGNSYDVYEKKVAAHRLRDNPGYTHFSQGGDVSYADFILKTAGVGVGIDKLTMMIPGERLTVFTPGFVNPHEDFSKLASVELRRRAEAIKTEIVPIAPSVIVKLANAAVRADMDVLLKVAEHCEMPSLVKIAKDDEEKSVNQILNLNFLGEENVDYFVEKLDTLQDAEDILTRLLVVSRISNIGINPDDVKDAIRGLSQTREKFEDVKRLRLAW